MSLYSFSVKPVSRLKGESAVKVAAYQSRGMLYDERVSKQYDFTCKTDLLYSEILLPATAPPKFLDRQMLWSSAEIAEKRYDARTSKAVIVALQNLQNELPIESQIELVRKFVTEAFVSLGMCVDIAIHDGQRIDQHYMHDHAGIIPDNPHLHILLTDRPVDKDGFCAKKNRDWNQKAYIRQWRELWERVLNHEFERRGLDTRVSCESLEVQQLGLEPKKHLGRTATALEKRGIQTDRGNKNREIEARNEERKEQQRQCQLERKRNRIRNHELSR